MFDCNAGAFAFRFTETYLFYCLAEQRSSVDPISLGLRLSFCLGQIIVSSIRRSAQGVVITNTKVLSYNRAFVLCRERA